MAVILSFILGSLFGLIAALLGVLVGRRLTRVDTDPVKAVMIGADLTWRAANDRRPPPAANRAQLSEDEEKQRKALIERLQAEGRLRQARQKDGDEAGPPPDEAHSDPAYKPAVRA